MCGKMQELRANEVGCDLMAIDAHSGARPSHAKWQGKIVSLSGKKGYLSKHDIGYGEATGFKGVNCHHDWLPHYEGSSTAFSIQQLNAWKKEKVKYNGKEISKYEATQIQRRMERTIREDKKELAVQQKLLTSNNKELNIDEIKGEINRVKAKEKEHREKLNDFLKQTELRKDNSRLVI